MNTSITPALVAMTLYLLPVSITMCTSKEPWFLLGLGIVLVVYTLLARFTSPGWTIGFLLAAYFAMILILQQTSPKEESQDKHLRLQVLLVVPVMFLVLAIATLRCQTVTSSQGPMFSSLWSPDKRTAEAKQRWFERKLQGPS